jgi:hypothetical protein
LTQYHFLDESGDPPPGSSSHFALAMVQLTEHAPLPSFAMARAARHLPAAFEFKYHKTTAIQKELFFRSMRPITFRVRAVVADKSRVTPGRAGLYGMSFVVEMITQLVMRSSALDIANDVLIMDGATPDLRRKLRIRLSEKCRTVGRSRTFAKIIGADSSRTDGLQLADMVVGAVRQHVMGTESRYYAMFANKVVDLWQR